MIQNSTELSSVLRLRHPFVKDVATLFSGKAAAGTVGLLLAPVIARLFSPEHFGVAALFVSLIVVLGPVSTLCYDQGIVLPDIDYKARNLGALAMTASLVTSMVIVLPLCVAFLWFPEIDVVARLGTFILLVPLGMILLAAVNVAENLHTRRRAFPAVARADVSQALATPLTRIGLAAAFGSSIWGLVTGYFCGLLVRLAVLSRLIVAELRNGVTSDPGELRQLAAEYRDFPLSNAPARFARAFSNQLPVIALGLLVSPLVVGIYAMAYRLVAMPGESVANSVRRVFLQRSAARHNAGESLHTLFRNTTLSMTGLALAVLLMIWLLADAVVPYLLGERWADVAQYMKLLGIWYVCVWAAVPASAMFVVLRRQEAWLRIQIWLAVLRIAFLFAAYLLNAEPLAMVAGFVAAGVLVNVGVVSFMAVYTRKVDTDERHVA